MNFHKTAHDCPDMMLVVQMGANEALQPQLYEFGQIISVIHAG